MSTLFGLLFLASVVGLIVGLIKPAWVKLPSRMRAVTVFGLSIFLFLILAALTSPSASNGAPVNAVTPTSPQATTSPDFSSMTPAEAALYTTTRNSVISADEAAGMSPAQAAASADGKPAPSTSSVNTAPLHGNSKYTFEYGYGYITLTNEDNFDWQECVFSDTALDVSTPTDIPKGQSYGIAAINFRINPQVYTGGPMSISNFDFMHSKSITIQCKNGQAEIDNVAQNFNKIAQ
jgi:hypothetical protein